MRGGTPRRKSRTAPILHFQCPSNNFPEVYSFFSALNRNANNKFESWYTPKAGQSSQYSTFKISGSFVSWSWQHVYHNLSLSDADRLMLLVNMLPKLILFFQGGGGSTSCKPWCPLGGCNCKNHLSHTDSVRLRLLLTIRFCSFSLIRCGAAACRRLLWIPLASDLLSSHPTSAAK